MFRKNSRLLSVVRAYLPTIKRMETEATTKDVVHKSISEGQAEITLIAEKVFYNPVQEFNRDLSIAVLSVFMEGYIEEQRKKPPKKPVDKKEEPPASSTKVEVTLLEALAATGLRSIRYAKEVPNLTKIVANDHSKQAVETMQVNFKLNNVDHLVETNHDDACLLMHMHKHGTNRFAIIDLDPYGCPSVFLDSAVQSIQDGGLLLITATDMAVLAGNSPETCYCKYGSVSLKTPCCHEMALRILLQSIEQHANRYSRYIVPLLSISADFYIRVFVKVYSGAVHCKKTTSKLSMVYQCVGCHTYALQPLGTFKPNPTDQNPLQSRPCLPTGPPVGAACDHCGQKHHLGGPIWSAPIHDAEFVEKLTSWLQGSVRQLGTYQRLVGILAMVREELLDVPLYYALDKMAGRLHLAPMPMLVMRSAIMNAGHEVSYSHASRMSVKTTAPASLLWDILRAWEKTHPVKPARLETNPVTRQLLSKEITHEVDFTERADANPVSRREGYLRFQFNPTPYWGPGSRAAVNLSGDVMDKAIRNQNKNKQKKRQHSDNEENTMKKTHLDTEAQEV